MYVKSISAHLHASCILVVFVVILFHLELYQHNSLMAIKFIFDFSVVNLV